MQSIEEIETLLESRENKMEEIEPETALEIYQKYTNYLTPIVTCHETLDSYLNGGVHLGEIYEFVGMPGIGKTQLCMQLACMVQFPKNCGGISGQCIYIDTQGGLIASRLSQIANACVRHIKVVNERRKNTNKNDEMTLEKMLSNILVYRIFEIDEFTNFLMNEINEILLKKKYSFINNR